MLAKSTFAGQIFVMNPYNPTNGSVVDIQFHRRVEDVCTDGGLLLLLNARQKAHNFASERTDAPLYDTVDTTTVMFVRTA